MIQDHAEDDWELDIPRVDIPSYVSKEILFRIYNAPMSLQSVLGVMGEHGINVDSVNTMCVRTACSRACEHEQLPHMFVCMRVETQPDLCRWMVV